MENGKKVSARLMVFVRSK